MIIQCDENVFNEVCDFMSPAEPIIIETVGGYIDCFDKGWIFINLDAQQLQYQRLINRLSVMKDAKYLIGVYETRTLIQRNVNEIEKYIFMRKGEILWGASSHIIFIGGK